MENTNHQLTITDTEGRMILEAFDHIRLWRQDLFPYEMDAVAVLCARIVAITGDESDFERARR